MTGIVQNTKQNYFGWILQSYCFGVWHMAWSIKIYSTKSYTPFSSVTLMRKTLRIQSDIDLQGT